MADNVDTHTEISSEDATTSGSALNVLSDDIDVEFNVTGKWNDGYNAEIKITNKSSSTIENWVLQFNFGEEISNIWDAKITQHKNDIYVIKNNVWNNNIAPNDTVTFGISGKCGEIVSEPYNFKLINNSYETSYDDYSVDFQVVSDWQTGYSAQIIITNNKDCAIEGWHLEFDFDKPITEIWNATIENKKDNRYYIVNNGYNANIPAHGSVTFGFNGDFGNIDKFPNSYLLKESDSDSSEIGDIQILIDEKYTVDSKKMGSQMYFSSSPINSLSGTLINSASVKRLYYSIIDESGNIIETNDLKVGKKWKITSEHLNNEGLTVYIAAEDKDGHKIFTSISYLSDKAKSDDDNDGIVNILEDSLNLSKTSEDTDGDGLLDGYELFVLGTSPTESDSDNNGIDDSAEDFDNDGLPNIDEYKYGTNPLHNDTDGDTLTDYDEIYIYHTNPLSNDTDEDKLNDDAEIRMELNPLEKDTDDNGILDCDEFINQTYTYKVDSSLKKEIKSVSVSLGCTGPIDDLVNITDIYNLDMKTSNVVGLIGTPVEISVNTPFETAQITFEYDVDELGDTKEDNLCIMRYDKDNDKYVLLEDSVLNTQNHTITYTTTHFSTYLVVDKEIWFDAWRQDINYKNSAEMKYYDVALVVDVSGSMSGSRLELAKSALKAFISAMEKGDYISIIKFNSTATLVQELTGDSDLLQSKIDSLVASGNTNANSGIVKGINELTKKSSSNSKMIMLICDGDVVFNESTIKDAIDNNIIIHCINVASGSSSAMQRIATSTGGVYYYAATSSDITDKISKIQYITLDGVDPKDTDGDGLYDVFETIGMRLSNGEIIYTDPTKKDTDNDGISDFDAMGGFPVYEDHLIDGDIYSCVVNHTNVYNKLSSDFIYVDGRINEDGTSINQKLSYIPYSNYFIYRVYDEPHDDEEINGITVSYNGDAGVHGVLSDKMTEKDIGKVAAYYAQCILIQSAILTVDVQSEICFYNYWQGIGGECAGFRDNGSRSYISGKFVVDEPFIFTNSGTKDFKKNMEKTIIAVESVLNEYNTEIYIAISPETIWEGCNYHSCTFDSIISKDSIYTMFNLAAFGTFNLANAGVVLHCTYDPKSQKYSMEYKYYIIDYYDFSFLDMLEELEAWGLAQSYELYGICPGKATWKKEDSFYFFHNSYI